MKKLLLILLFIPGCISSLTEEERDAILKQKQQIEQRLFESYVTVIEYKGHSYIFYRYPSGSSSNAALEHDPDCRCQK